MLISETPSFQVIQKNVKTLKSEIFFNARTWILISPRA
jgi:hypothetical protein